MTIAHSPVRRGLRSRRVTGWCAVKLALLVAAGACAWAATATLLLR